MLFYAKPDESINAKQIDLSLGMKMYSEFQVHQHSEKATTSETAAAISHYHTKPTDSSKQTLLLVLTKKSNGEQLN